MATKTAHTQTQRPTTEIESMCILRKENSHPEQESFGIQQNPIPAESLLQTTDTSGNHQVEIIIDDVTRVNPPFGPSATISPVAGSPTMSSDDPIADSASEYVPSEESDISFDWENFSPHTPSDFERNDSPTVMEANCSPRSVEINKRKRIRRGHRCLFCDCEVKDFARHLERHHSDEIEVQRFMSLKKCSMKRK
nr:unnamed protein product [Callosobruchus analis]